MSDQLGPYTAQEAVDAFAEAGPLVGRIVCGVDGCDVGKIIGHVHESSRGLVLDAGVVGRPLLPKDLWDDARALSKAYGVKPPPSGARRLRVVLLERPRRPDADSPSVDCAVHGTIEMIDSDLVAEIRRSPKKIATLRASGI